MSSTKPKTQYKLAKKKGKIYEKTTGLMFERGSVKSKVIGKVVDNEFVEELTEEDVALCREHDFKWDETRVVKEEPSVSEEPEEEPEEEEDPEPEPSKEEEEEPEEKVVKKVLETVEPSVSEEPEKPNVSEAKEEPKSSKGTDFYLNRLLPLLEGMSASVNRSDMDSRYEAQESRIQMLEMEVKAMRELLKKEKESFKALINFALTRME